MMRWHKALNRMGDPAYLALSPVAQAALRNLEELAHGGPVVGNRARLCLMLGVAPKHGRFAIEPLIEAGFVEADEASGQLRLSLPEAVRQAVSNGASKVLQEGSKGTPTVLQEGSNGTSKGLQQGSNGTPTVLQQGSNGDKELADGAGSSDPALIKSKSKNESKSKSKNHLPAIPPAGFLQWWALYPRKLQRQAALAAWCKLSPSAELEALILAATGKAAASADWQGRMLDDPSLRTIPLPATWLNGARWEDEYNPPLPTAPTPPTVIDRERLNAIRMEQQLRRGGVPQSPGSMEVGTDRSGGDLSLLSGGEFW